MTQQVEHKHMSKAQLLLRFLFLTVGALIVALSLKAFFVPNNIIDGGITGISLTIAHMTHLPLGIFLFVLNLPFIILGYKQLGKTFAISTLYGITVMSIGTLLFKDVGSLTQEPVLAALCGGVGLGLGVGLVIRYGGTVDGTEVVAIDVNRKTGFSIGQIIMFLNVFIIGSSSFVFGFDNAMYSMLAYYVAFKVIDLVVEGLIDTKSVWIISDKHREIGEALTARLGRGITYFHGEGGFEGEQKKIIFTVISRLEEAKMKNIVEDYDPNAFVAIGVVADVKGGQFKKKNIH